MTVFPEEISLFLALKILYTAEMYYYLHIYTRRVRKVNIQYEEETKSFCERSDNTDHHLEPSAFSS